MLYPMLSNQKKKSYSNFTKMTVKWSFIHSV